MEPCGPWESSSSSNSYSSSVVKAFDRECEFEFDDEFRKETRMAAYTSGTDMTIGRVARALSIRRRTVRAWIRDRSLPSSVRGWRRRVAVDDLVRFLCARFRQLCLTQLADVQVAPARTSPPRKGTSSLDAWELVDVTPLQGKTATELIPRKVARAYNVFGFDLSARPQKLLAAYPTNNPEVLDGLVGLLGGPVQLVVADRDPERNKEIVMGLLDGHFPCEAREDVSDDLKEEKRRVGTDPMGYFLRFSGDVHVSPGESPIARLTGLMVAEALGAGATGLALRATGDGTVVDLLWNDERTNVDSPPWRLFWPLAFAFMAFLGLDVTRPNEPQQGRVDVRCKNGLVKIEATMEPTELGPSFRLSLQRSWPSRGQPQ